MAAKAGMHAHEQQDVDLIQMREHRVERGVRIQHQPHFHAVCAHTVEQRPRITELDVHGATVRAGRGELVEQISGVVDHEVAVEVHVGTRTQAFDHWRADRQVRHEVAVHDVDVQQIGIGSDRLHLSRQLREVTREDRRCDFSHCRHPTGGPAKSGCTCRPSLPHAGAAGLPARAPSTVRRADPAQ